MMNINSLEGESTWQAFQPLATHSLKASLPTMYDLPSELPGEPGVPDEFHIYQPQLLRETFLPPHYRQDEILVAIDLNLYYDLHHLEWYKRPDWFAVLGIARAQTQAELRLSYVMWQEEVAPFIAVELLSPGTEKEDLGQTLRKSKRPPTKWQVYEQILRIPYYIIFGREVEQPRAFKLVGERYQELAWEQGRLWLPELQLGLGLWDGEYQGIEGHWLRWYDAKQQWLPTPEEQIQLAEMQTQQAQQQARQAQQQVRQAQQQAQQAEQRADTTQRQLELEQRRVAELMAQLKRLGIEPK